MKNPCISVLAAAALLCGCSKPAETGLPADQLGQLRRHAERAMLEETTNEVPGIRAIISAAAVTESKSLPQWTGLVTLDYVNHNGGIDRTNLHMTFIPAGENIAAVPDSAYYQQQYLAHLHRIETGQEH